MATPGSFAGQTVAVAPVMQRDHTVAQVLAVAAIRSANGDGYFEAWAARFTTLPAAVRSISTESLACRNHVLGFFMPHFP